MESRTIEQKKARISEYIDLNLLEQRRIDFFKNRENNYQTLYIFYKVFLDLLQQENNYYEDSYIKLLQIIQDIENNWKNYLSLYS